MVVDKKLNHIKKLPKSLINKIAAGEVVERPSSVIKELVENSLDANANEITIKIEAGGTKLIEVADNGIGMNSDNAVLAFEQHATSKISSIEDLESLYTLGFRGEALASIGSVSEASIHSYDGETTPVLVKYSENIPTSELGQGRKKGTTVSIRNLFNNIPARKKFLRQEQTEYKYIVTTFLNLAIANNQTSFRLIKDGKTAYEFNKTPNIKDRITQVFPAFKDQLIPIYYDSPEIRISGFIGHPSTSRRDKNHQFLYVNKRPVSDRLISKAIKDGFSTTLMNHMHPSFFIFLDINPDLVDVNIHPRKQEVRFNNTSQIYTAILHSVEKSLSNSLKENLQDTLAPTKQPNEFNFKNKRSDSYSYKPVQSGNSFNTTGGPKKIKDSIDFTKSILSASEITDTKPLDNTSERDTRFTLDSKDSFTILQVLNTYLIVEREGKILIIDQHAADERIKFEQIKNTLENKSKLKQQDLLIPESISISEQQSIIANQYIEDFEKLGFKILITKNNKLEVSQIPILLSKTNIKETIEEIMSELEETDGVSTNAFEQAKNKILASLACHGSIRAGRTVHSSEAKKLISDLFDCKLPYSCPHGRPIIWELSRYEIEKQFKRKI